MAKKQINLALQGGGAHGAFTWGVLDTLLMDNRVEIGAISGTSAGAMNAVLVADGLVHGGPEKACQKLEDFWLAVSDAAKSSPIRRSPLDVLMNNWSLDNSPGFFMMDMMSRMLTPQQMNPLKLNPLRDILVEHVDFDNVCGCNVMQIFISATNVETGRVKVFDRTTLDADKVMASACLPFMFEPVEIDGEYYYDGGYMGNPALLPLNSATDIRDLLVVQINPVCRPGVPKTAAEIMNRVNEITFNSSLLKELRALDFIARLTEEGELDSPEYKPMRLHILEATDELLPLGASSKLNAERAFLLHLRDIGRTVAEEWLAENYADIGKKSTFNVREMFKDTGLGYEIPARPEHGHKEAAE